MFQFSPTCCCGNPACEGCLCCCQSFGTEMKVTISGFPTDYTIMSGNGPFGGGLFGCVSCYNIISGCNINGEHILTAQSGAGLPPVVNCLIAPSAQLCTYYNEFECEALMSGYNIFTGISTYWISPVLGYEVIWITRPDDIFVNRECSLNYWLKTITVSGCNQTLGNQIDIWQYQTYFNMNPPISSNVCSDEIIASGGYFLYGGVCNFFTGFHPCPYPSSILITKIGSSNNPF